MDELQNRQWKTVNGVGGVYFPETDEFLPLMKSPALPDGPSRDLTDDELTPLSFQLRYLLRRVIQASIGQPNFREVIRKSYWINWQFPVVELLEVTGCADEQALLDYMGEPRFEHLCPRCLCLTDFVMTRRGYRRDRYLCPTCQKEITHGVS